MRHLKLTLLLWSAVTEAVILLQNRHAIDSLSLFLSNFNQNFVMSLPVRQSFDVTVAGQTALLF